MSRCTLGLVATLALATGCVDALQPVVGDPLRPGCSDEDSDPGRAVSFHDQILTGLFARTDLACADCHTPAGKNPIGVRGSGLNLTSHASLLRGGITSGASIVLPGQPCTSILVQKLGQAPPFGARMPLDGPPFLTERELQVISDWIAEGADDN
jgi:hypothetical protein